MLNECSKNCKKFSEKTNMKNDIKTIIKDQSEMKNILEIINTSMNEAQDQISI